MPAGGRDARLLDQDEEGSLTRAEHRPARALIEYLETDR